MRVILSALCFGLLSLIGILQAETLDSCSRGHCVDKQHVDLFESLGFNKPCKGAQMPQCENGKPKLVHLGLCYVYQCSPQDKPVCKPQPSPMCAPDSKLVGGGTGTDGCPLASTCVTDCPVTLNVPVCPEGSRLEPSTDGCAAHATCVTDKKPVCPLLQPSPMCAPDSKLVGGGTGADGCPLPAKCVKDTPIERCPEYQIPICKQGEKVGIRPGAIAGCNMPVCVTDKKPVCPLLQPSPMCAPDSKLVGGGTGTDGCPLPAKCVSVGAECPLVKEKPSCETGTNLVQSKNENGCMSYACSKPFVNPECQSNNKPICGSGKKLFTSHQDLNGCPVYGCVVEPMRIN